MIEVDGATERLRDISLALLGVIYILPLGYVLPPYANVVVTASLAVFAACLRTVGKTNEAELLSQKVVFSYLRVIDGMIVYLDAKKDVCLRRSTCFVPLSSFIISPSPCFCARDQSYLSGKWPRPVL
jgi:hypothetical protein